MLDTKITSIVASVGFVVFTVALLLIDISIAEAASPWLEGR